MPQVKAGTAILSIQSRVIYGHVGNAVAEFAIRRLGFDCWPIDTVSFSNHPGYGRHRGRIHDASEIEELVEGLADIGALQQCRAVLSGYLGSAANGRAVLDAVARVKAARTDALWCCDPVIGDRDVGCYVPDEVTRFFAEEALPAADILTPNHFELEVLSGRPLPAAAAVIEAAEALRARGPRVVVVSSVPLPADVDAGVATVLVAGKGVWIATTPLLPLAAKGAGDLLAALFLGHLLRTGEPDRALERSAASIRAILERTAVTERQELSLTVAQDALVRPPRRVTLRRVR